MFLNKQKPYTITVIGTVWFCAYCEELDCTGFGETVEDALDSCKICMRTILSLHLKIVKGKLSHDYRSISNITLNGESY